MIPLSIPEPFPLWLLRNRLHIVGHDNKRHLCIVGESGGEVLYKQRFPISSPDFQWRKCSPSLRRRPHPPHTLFHSGCVLCSYTKTCGCLVTERLPSDMNNNSQWYGRKLQMFWQVLKQQTPGRNYQRDALPIDAIPPHTSL